MTITRRRTGWVMGTLCVVFGFVVLMYVLYQYVSGLEQTAKKFQEAVMGGVLDRQVGLSDDVPASLWGYYIRELTKKVIEEETDPVSRKAVFHGYALLYQAGVSPETLRAKVEPVFADDAVPHGMRPRAFYFAEKHHTTVYNKLTMNLFGTTNTSALQQRYVKDIVSVWSMFPISNSALELYQRVYVTGQKITYGHSGYFLEANADKILKAVEESLIVTVP